MAAYIKFDGIDGEVVEKDHDKWTELSNISTNLTKTGGSETSAKRVQGTTVFEDIEIGKLMDKTTPKLWKAMAEGKSIPKVQIHLSTTTDTGPQVYMAYELKDVYITNFSTSADADGRPEESISLNYEEIKVEYYPIDSKGKRGGAIDFAWSVPKGKPA